MTSPSSKPKVLVFIDWFLPGEKAGGPVRSCANLLDHLSDTYSFSIVTRNTDYTETKPYPDIVPNTWTHQHSNRVYYCSEDQLNASTFTHLLQTEQPDCVYLNGVWSKQFTIQVLHLIRKLKKRPRVILATRGMLAPSAIAIKAFKKKSFLMYAKLTGLYRDVCFHATNEDEANDVRRVFGAEVEIRIAGNLPRKIQVDQCNHFEKKTGSLRLLSVARVAPEKNILFAIQMLARVQAPVVFDVYGPVYDEAYARACSDAIAQLPAHIQVRLCGAILSDALAQTYAQYDALFLPTRGENFGHTILEAMQFGLPVLISDQTPWRGLEAKRAGWDVPLDDQQLFVKQLEQLAALTDVELGIWRDGALQLADRYCKDQELVEANKHLFSL